MNNPARIRRLAQDLTYGGAPARGREHERLLWAKTWALRAMRSAFDRREAKRAAKAEMLSRKETLASGCAQERKTLARIAQAEKLATLRHDADDVDEVIAGLEIGPEDRPTLALAIKRMSWKCSNTSERLGNVQMSRKCFNKTN